MKKLSFILLVLITLVTTFWLMALVGFSFSGFGIAILAVAWIPAFGLARGLVWIARRVSYTIWITAGILVLAGLFFPTSLLPGYSLEENVPEPYRAIITVLLLVMPFLAFVLASLLLYSGLNVYQVRSKASRLETDLQLSRGRLEYRTIVCFGLGGLLIAKTLYNLYWLTVWDNTYDPLGYLWLVIPILAALFSSLILTFILSGKVKYTGLAYGMLVPAMLFATSFYAQNVDFHQLTQSHAAEVTQALEAYHINLGHYPLNLRQLVPWYSLSLPGPVIINGQDWCYDAGPDYYRLGYVDRKHWSDPNLTGHLFATAGTVPNLTPICSQEIAVLRSN